MHLKFFTILAKLHCFLHQMYHVVEVAAITGISFFDRLDYEYKRYGKQEVE